MEQPPYPPPLPAPEQPPYSAYPSYGNQPPPPVGYPQPYGNQPGYQSYPGYPSPMFPQQPAKPVARKYGLIFGAVMAGGALLFAVVSQMLIQTWMRRTLHLSTSTVGFYIFALFALFALVYWTLYFFAGLLTARRTQRVDMATSACLWAALCYFVMYCLILIYNIIQFPHSSVISTFASSYFSSLAINVVLVLIVNIGLGIGVGTLGGLLGRDSARSQFPPMMPPMVPPM